MKYLCQIPFSPVHVRLMGLEKAKSERPLTCNNAKADFESHKWNEAILAEDISKYR